MTISEFVIYVVIGSLWRCNLRITNALGMLDMKNSRNFFFLMTSKRRNMPRKSLRKSQIAKSRPKKVEPVIPILTLRGTKERGAAGWRRCTGCIFQYFLLTSKRARCLGNFCDLCVGDDVRDDALLRKRRQIDRNQRKCAAAWLLVTAFVAGTTGSCRLSKLKI